MPEFRYHFFEEGISFSILDKITITPIAGTILIALQPSLGSSRISISHALLVVEHGRFFGNPSPSYSSTPSALGSSVPTPPDTDIATQEEPVIIPYLAYGFIIDALTCSAVPSEEKPPTLTRVVYLSDVSKIPERTWDIITRPVSLTSLKASLSVIPAPLTTKGLATNAASAYQPAAALPVIPSLVIMDCLRPKNHSSHFGLAQAYSACRRLLNPETYRKAPYNPQKTTSNSWHGTRVTRGRAYMVGFAHEYTAAEWDCVGDILVGERAPSEFSNVGDDAESSEDNWREKDGGVRPDYVAKALYTLVDAIPSLTRTHESPGSKVGLSPQPIAEADRIWMRPGWDGLRLFLRGQDIFDHDPANGFDSI